MVEVVDDGSLLELAYLKAQQIMLNSPFGVALTKEGMWSALEIPGMQAAIDLENRQQIMASATAVSPTLAVPTATRPFSITTTRSLSAIASSISAIDSTGTSSCTGSRFLVQRWRHQCCQIHTRRVVAIVPFRGWGGGDSMTP